VRLGQRQAERKINGIKHLASVLETACCPKNYCKNKDLRDGVKALSELVLWATPVFPYRGAPSFGNSELLANLAPELVATGVRRVAAMRIRNTRTARSLMFSSSRI
jgi:hypothetical protein